MFSQNSQIPNKEPCKNLPHNPRRQRKKPFKKRKGNKRKNHKKDTAQPFINTTTMSSWAESFTHAATWQLKQQVAYWKSKATALEYENGLLHEIIRNNYVGGTQREADERNDTDCGLTDEITETVEESQSSESEDGNDEEFEVSEEYIQFLMQNAKYKEDAKREREKFKASQNTEQNLIEEMEATPCKSTESKEEILHDIYGENWQRISALETSIQSQFISNCDEDQPEYWPNIPLNFNFK